MGQTDKSGRLVRVGDVRSWYRWDQWREGADSPKNRSRSNPAELVQQCRRLDGWMDGWMRAKCVVNKKQKSNSVDTRYALDKTSLLVVT